MKRTKWLTITAVMSILLMGCDKDDNPLDPGTNLKNGTLTASISGDLTLNFQCSAAYGLQSKSDAGQGITGLMHIQGLVTQGSDEYMIDIQVYHDPATGTYQLEFPPVEGVATVTKNNTGNISKSGSVTFTQVSETRMAGTFSFTAFRMVSVGVEATVTVTSGTFNVPVILIDK